MFSWCRKPKKQVTQNYDGLLQPNAPFAYPNDTFVVATYDGRTAGSSTDATSTNDIVSHRQSRNDHGDNSVQKIYHRLVDIWASNKLQPFYSDADLCRIATEIAQKVNFNSLANEWGFDDREKIYELVALGLYDVIILADDSGSMIEEPGAPRVKELNRVCTNIAKVVSLFDDDGISIRFLHPSKNRDYDNVREESEINQIIIGAKYGGHTPLTENLAKIIEPIITAAKKNVYRKPTLIIIMTDGIPNIPGESTQISRKNFVDLLSTTKRELKRTKYGICSIGFEIAQIGDDAAAQQWLDDIDNVSDVEDIVDVTSSFEIESAQYERKNRELNYYKWLLKLCLGGIDRKYDAEDE